MLPLYRSTQGVRAINLADDDRVASVERMLADPIPVDENTIIQPG